MSRKPRIIFTDNKRSKRGIMAIVLAVICICSLLYSFIYSYHTEGNIASTFGGALVVTLIMAVVGICLGVSAGMDNSKFKLFPTIGTVLNSIVLVILAGLLWIGLK